MDDQEELAEEAIVEVKVTYDYLLSMPISSLTLEKVHHRAIEASWILFHHESVPVAPPQGCSIVPSLHHIINLADCKSGSRKCSRWKLCI